MALTANLGEPRVGESTVPTPYEMALRFALT